MVPVLGYEIGQYPGSRLVARVDSCFRKSVFATVVKYRRTVLKRGIEVSYGTICN
jgi:hypothetical protein